MGDVLASALPASMAGVGNMVFADFHRIISALGEIGIPTAHSINLIIHRLIDLAIRRVGHPAEHIAYGLVGSLDFEVF
jgi:hypothetical protein